MSKQGAWLLGTALLAGSAHAQLFHDGRGESVEHQLPSDRTFTQWVKDPSVVNTQTGDRVEVRDVAGVALETVKLTNLVPPIHFESGVAEIPPTTVASLRAILTKMHDKKNVRLHLVGHADTQRLSPALAAKFGDNEGLSRERAGEVAEFLQRSLELPPEAISYEWAGDTRPIASNATPEGRAQNRRVEVEVWYDQPKPGVAHEEVLVQDDFRRVKVCRTQTVCRLSYVEGQERRTRVQNLVPPLRFTEDAIDVSASFVEQIGQALRNMSDRHNVLVKFIGYTDDATLSERDERIYGTREGLSKARARRVALAVQEALKLPTAAIDSDGRGSARPLGSNATALGRAMNRRVEVEFWYDDPLQELPDEPQLCPAPGNESVTRVYDPPWGAIPRLELENGRPIVPAGYAATLRRALADVADKTNPRLRFLGYTANETLERRTALVYEDDIGLSAARARRAMETVGAELGLDAAQLEFEGRGYVQSDDVVNAGFVQGPTSYVAVQVVYDEVAQLDDYDGVNVTPLKRELAPQSAYGLNMMRITVDGEPIDDPGRSSEDIQRCTDVALQKANIEFGFDNLEAARRLAVAARPARVLLHAGDDGPIADPVRFSMYANYSHFIERAELRVFDSAESLEATPLAVIALGPDGSAEWQPSFASFVAPTRELKYVLRAYGKDGTFDETIPQPLWLVYTENEPRPGDAPAGTATVAAPAAAPAGDAATPAVLWDEATSPTSGTSPASGDGDSGASATDSAIVATAASVSDAVSTAVESVLAFASRDETAPADAKGPAYPNVDDASLRLAYGENRLGLRNIPLASGSVTVRGSAIPPGHSVWVAGRPVPVDASGNFVAQEIMPAGVHTVEVAVLDDAGNGELYLRDIELKHNDWFYVGMADVTLSHNESKGPIELLQGDNSTSDLMSSADAELAFYLNGKFAEGWRLTASADTRDAPMGDLFSNFLNKTPESLFRRIDPDYHYPTFGDDGVVEEMAPTLGKFYVKVAHGDDYGLWGNFKIAYMDNELAQVDRGLYGANLHYESERTTSFGERRYAVDGFTAEPGTVSSYEEFRGTGGSLYYLHRQDLLTGSERVRIEVRDRASGLVTGVVNLTPGIDYDIDYLQGRILLSEPLSSNAKDDLIVRGDSLAGDEAYLVVRYEYTPGFTELDALSVGAQGHYWFGDRVKVGLTANNNDQGDTKSGLDAADVTVRISSDSWFKLQGAQTQGLITSEYRSVDGGFGFTGYDDSLFANVDQAGGYRADVSLGLGDFISRAKGRVTLYKQDLDAGYSMAGLATPNALENYGGTFRLPLTTKLSLNAKMDRRVQELGLETKAQEIDVAYKLTENWGVSTGVRDDLRIDRSPVVPLTQEQGERKDAVVQVEYDSKQRWSAYGYVQDTLATTGDREENGRVGTGGSYRITEQLRINAEVSDGDLGHGAILGTRYMPTDRTSLYMNYALENERAEESGLQPTAGAGGSLITGMKTRLSDSTSVYLEERYRNGAYTSGLTHSTGVNLAPTQALNLGASTDIGTLRDMQTGAETKREAAAFNVGYGLKSLQLSTGVEYRTDDTEQPDLTFTTRKTWLFRNNFKYQITDAARLIGKLNFSQSQSSLGAFYDGGYAEGVLGFAYRPVRNDRLNTLFKYTYFYNMPTTDQLTLRGTAAEFLQISHVVAVDVTYDLTPRWTLGGKYAHRIGEMSLSRDDPQYFDNPADLVVIRADFRFLENWEGMLEGRALDMPDTHDRRSGSVFVISRYLNKHLKLGVGYNFTDFSDDLTDLSFNHRGVFLSMTGAM
jgi:flagellar motor protein MotB